MFDTLLMRPNASRTYAMDYGQMIENLLYYKKTIVHINRNAIPGLFDLADIPVLEDLLKMNCLNVYYNNSYTTVGKQGDIYFVDSIGLSNLDLEKELYEESFTYKGDAARSKKFAKKISRLITEFQLPSNFSSTLIEQLKDEDFRKQAVLQTFNHYAPDQPLIPNQIEYNFNFVNSTQFKLETNISVTDPTKIAIDSPILSLVNACEDLKVMSDYSSEISLPDFNAKMIQAKTNLILSKSAHARGEINAFNHFVFNHSWALREAINNKDIHVKAVMDVIRNANKFKDWLNAFPDDTNLLYEYVKKYRKKASLKKCRPKPHVSICWPV
ncbi:hypothetical protein ACQ86N_42260 [Puia sp. P3]|uniref:hypothetical protein n=1 Tax=Puia sp. P3 TaxID=3423952 RepID=UPI003D669CFF